MKGLRAVFKLLWLEQTFSHKWGQKHKLTDTYINNIYVNVINLWKFNKSDTEQAENNVWSTINAWNNAWNNVNNACNTIS